MTITREKIFDLDMLYELSERYELESVESGDARITVSDSGLFTLTIFDVPETSVTVYHTTVKQLDLLYVAMDEKYIDVLENSTSGSDFWDQWHSVIELLEPYKIAEESFR